MRMPGLTVAVWLMGVGSLPAQGVVVLVVDEQSRPLEGALGQVHDLLATSGRDGMMYFLGLAPGQYQLTVRFIGYHPDLRNVVVTAGAPSRILVKMNPAPVLLPPVVVEAVRPGVFGVVSDDQLRPLAGAAVELLGRRGRTATADSLGEFSFPLAAGVNMLRVTYPGHYERRFAVTVPDGGGQEVLVQLPPADARFRETGVLARQALLDLRERLSWGRRRDLMTREDLANFASGSICDMPVLNTVVRNQRGTTLGLVDGWQVTWNVCSFRTDEVDLVEWGDSVCGDPTGMLARMFAASCQFIREEGGTVARGRVFNSAREVPGYIIVWQRH